MDYAIHETKAVLFLLGFETEESFFRYSGINHQTAREMLGIVPLKTRKRHYVLLKFMVNIHAAYNEGKARMDKHARRFVLMWVLRWIKRASKDLLWLERENDDLLDPRLKNQRRLDRMEREIDFQNELNALKWE